jgi:hypothetical protein
MLVGTKGKPRLSSIRRILQLNKTICMLRTCVVVMHASSFSTCILAGRCCKLCKKGIENAMSLRCSTWPDLIVDGNVINTGKS